MPFLRLVQEHSKQEVLSGNVEYNTIYLEKTQGPHLKSQNIKGIK